MFTKILIANRGEIAARVARSARAMGVRTVAVYSEADAAAVHVAACDEAVPIGPAAVAESYLKADRIIAAARATGAEAIHPGYGFLSENPDFVEAVEAAGLVFIGPSASAIRAMGLKDAAKALMEEAGVPVVPGYHGEEQDPHFLAGEADAIGYPVLIKARAGGGGKGMRRVDDPKDFAEALAGAQREGQASFGDGRVLIEKYITSPRHIEIQVFGDGHGNAVHLFERDCSLQRRHQKVIEEAPAPGMTAEMREAMGAAAVRAARAIGYSGAGTVEFIVDGSDGLRPDRFWFMEMNTRLQVEHPVTEAITGLDLVDLQLRVAAGAPLPVTQDDLSITGHSVEARLYAEDPAKGFLPQTGRLHRLRLPDARARIDSGVREGDVVTPHYDPMIAKVITHGATRAEALGKLHDALAASEIAGCTTNAAFLQRLVRHPVFAAGEMDTGLIDRELDALTAPLPPMREAPALAALSLLGLDAPRAGLIGANDGFRLWGPEVRDVTLKAGEEDHPLSLAIHGHGRFSVTDGEGTYALTLVGGRYAADDGPRRPVSFARVGASVTVIAGGRAAAFHIPDPEAAADAAEAADVVTAPMPGLVKLVSVAAGDRVEEGAALIVMEAMKMEHRLTAPRAGVVAELLCAEGAQVEDGAILLRLEEEETADA
ncbi:acetyl/propionyl/methylcrotonyl-CoA carboxylase subunit alpha [Rhodovulum sp. DZ06]|uniref:acetyl/propionyl/methylcrotonyl-CoA carboxylase subunit alpha n=1 Tax=Rhodovulum sp. DZ06 TaxID=3425126 RepID=UPI003D330B92